MDGIALLVLAVCAETGARLESTASEPGPGVTALSKGGCPARVSESPAELSSRTVANVFILATSMLY